MLILPYIWRLHPKAISEEPWEYLSISELTNKDEDSRLSREKSLKSKRHKLNIYFFSNFCYYKYS